MNATEEVKVTETTAKDKKIVQEKTPNYDNMVMAKAPKHPGLKCVIKKLWNGAYRINYHNPENSNYIDKSYFAEVIDEKQVRYTWSEMINKTVWKDFTKTV